LKCECGERMTLKLADIGQAVICNGMVWSADLYRCKCGKTKLGTYGVEPIRPLDDWGKDWIMQPKHPHELEV